MRERAKRKADFKIDSFKHLSRGTLHGRIKLLSEAKLLNEISVPESRLPPYKLLVAKPLNTPKTCKQSVPAISCPPDIDIKIPLLKMPLIWPWDGQNSVKNWDEASPLSSLHSGGRLYAGENCHRKSYWAIDSECKQHCQPVKQDVPISAVMANLV